MLKRLNIALLVMGLLVLLLAIAASLMPGSEPTIAETPSAPSRFPTSTLTSSPTPQDVDDDAAIILELVNRARCNEGLLPLTLNPLLTQAALEHSTRMATGGFFDHLDPSDQSGPADRITAAGYEWYTIGENIAAGGETAEITFADWWDSPPHRENILHPDFREMGLAHVYLPESLSGHYWTQTFGTQREAYGAPPLVTCSDIDA